MKILETFGLAYGREWSLAVSSAVEWIQNAWKSTGEWFNNLWKSIKEGADNVWTTIQEAPGKRQIGSRINGLKQKSSFRVYGTASKKLPVPLGKEL